VHEADDVRLGRIADKLAAARAMPELRKAFGVDAHRFVLGPPLPADAVADFEARHGVTLPPAYRSFLLELGDGGAGPGCGLRRLADSCAEACRRSHLALASPYLPGPRYLNDWEQRYEDPPDRDREFLRGTLEIAGHGCTLGTRLIVTGPARGRLFNLDNDGPVGPYVLEDIDLLAWYERWLDELAAGYDIGFFGERLPLDEPELITALADDPSPARRTRAGQSLLQLPMVSDAARSALAHAIASDPDPTLRATLLQDLSMSQAEPHRRWDPDEQAVEQVATYARSCVPPGLDALALLGRLTFDDFLSELASHNLEQRRGAAYLLARGFGWASQEKPPQQMLDEVARRLLGDPDPLIRYHGVDIVANFDLCHLRPVLRVLRECESDRWVLDNLRGRLGDEGEVADGFASFWAADDPWARSDT
jgi:hypothetical protein